MKPISKLDLVVLTLTIVAVALTAGYAHSSGAPPAVHTPPAERKARLAKVACPKPAQLAGPLAAETRALTRKALAEVERTIARLGFRLVRLPTYAAAASLARNVRIIDWVSHEVESLNTTSCAEVGYNDERRCYVFHIDLEQRRPARGGAWSGWRVAGARPIEMACENL